MDGDIINGKNNVNALPGSLKALTAFYASFNQRDVEASMKNWAHRDDVVMCNPIGGIRTGWDDILLGYRRIMQGEVQVYVEFHDYQLTECEDIFYVVGRERGHAQCQDQDIELAIRTSRVFRRFDNGQSDAGWYQVHHHGSIDDPALLNQYQSFIYRNLK